MQIIYLEYKGCKYKVILYNKTDLFAIDVWVIPKDKCRPAYWMRRRTGKFIDREIYELALQQVRND